MSEVNLEALAHSDNTQIESKAPTPMQEIDAALKACTFGRFHIRLLCTSLIGTFAGVFVSTTTGYLLPIAECDLGMNLVQKGFLNAVPYLGMLVSSAIAGFLSDSFGRKSFLYIGYGGVFIFTLTSACSQSYDVLVTAKFFEGLFFAISFSPTVTLTSEYCYRSVRDRVMFFQSSYIGLAQILTAAMAWGLLTRDWGFTLFGGYLGFNTWNIFLLVVSLFSFTALILYTFIPESPKFLASQHRYNEARELLIKIYMENTGKPADTYLYKDLWKGKVFSIVEEQPKKVENISFTKQLAIGFKNLKPMFHKPLGMYLLLLCTMNFLTLMLYNVIRLWFPQLSTIMEHYSDVRAYEGKDLCVLLDAYTADLNSKISNMTVNEVCVPKLSGTETYINSIILGLICILPYIINGALVNKVGKKALIIAGCVICTACTLGIRFANSKIAVVALFSVDTAISQGTVSLFQALAIELFPTTIRTLAISMIMTLGRVGTLTGNVTFPMLLEKGCTIPFYTLTTIMLVVTIMTFAIPKKKK